MIKVEAYSFETMEIQNTFDSLTIEEQEEFRKDLFEYLIPKAKDAIKSLKQDHVYINTFQRFETPKYFRVELRIVDNEIGSLCNINVFNEMTSIDYWDAVKKAKQNVN